MKTFDNEFMCIRARSCQRENGDRSEAASKVYLAEAQIRYGPAPAEIVSQPKNKKINKIKGYTFKMRVGSYISELYG